jgi:Flp pilus assembly pilin Flp
MINYLQQLLSTIQMRTEAVLRAEEGQGLAEYALILFFIAVVAVASLTLLGGKISLLLSEVASNL